MKKLTMVLCLLFVAAVLAACATYPIPITATGQQIEAPVKEGAAVGKTYFWLLGDASGASIANAARNGRVTRISTVDFNIENLFGIVQTYTCTVTGE